MRHVRIAIGIVDNHIQLYKQFAMSLIGVVTQFHQWAQKQEDCEYSLDILMAENGRIDDMRNTIANQAVREKYDYIFWMDSDMVFPHDCLPLMLMYCEKDGHEAVSGLYTFKVPPFSPHIYPRIDESTGKFEMPISFPLKEPFSVAGAGFGCLLMKVSIFERMKAPYFSIIFQDNKMIKGEDLEFCKAANMDIILDPNISCGHLKLNQLGIQDFMGYNGLEPVEDWVRPSKEQQDKISEKLEKLFD